MSDENNDQRPEKDEAGQTPAPEQGEAEGYTAAPGAIDESGTGPVAPAERPAPGRAAPPPPPPPGFGGSSAPWGPPKPPPTGQAPYYPPPGGAQPPVGFGPPRQPPRQQPYPPQAAPPPAQQQAPMYPAQPQVPPPYYASQPPPPGGGYGPPPGYRPPGPPMPPLGGYPQPPRRRNRTIPVIIGLVIFLVVISSGIAALLAGSSGTSSGGTFSSFYGNKVAVLEVEGVIGEGAGYAADTKQLVEQVKSWGENDNIKALVVRVNSPGGAVSATQDLYYAIEDFKSRKVDGRSRPVVISMGDIAASGGYYTAMAGDAVYANEGSLTGSIGVIMSFYDYQEFQDMIGIKPRSVKSGEFKDIGSGSRAMTSEEKELLQATIDDVYTQFLDAVVEARGERVRQLINNTDPDAVTDEEVRAHVKELCDGRIFSGKQAYSYGMIDKLGTLDDAIADAAQRAGLPEDVGTVHGPVRPKGLFGSISNVASTVEHSIPGGLQGSILIEYRFAGW